MHFDELYKLQHMKGTTREELDRMCDGILALARDMKGDNMTEKKDKKNFVSDADSDYFSLSKLVGKKIADVIGYPSDPFGGTPLFKLIQIVFEDKTTVFLEGEHDVPYLPADSQLNNMDEDTLQKFIDEDE